MKTGRKYQGVYLEPTAEGWKSLCFGRELTAATLAEIKRAVRDAYPPCLRLR